MSFHSELRWHNTVAQDFTASTNPSTYVAGGKRSAGVAFAGNPEANSGLVQLPGQSQIQLTQTPSKKHKASYIVTQFSTPVKGQSTSPTKCIVPSASSGIQTPPPSTTSTTKRRGRPPKKLQGLTGSSTVTKPTKPPKKPKVKGTGASKAVTNINGSKDHAPPEAPPSRTPQSRAVPQPDAENPFVRYTAAPSPAIPTAIHDLNASGDGLSQNLELQGSNFVNAGTVPKNIPAPGFDWPLLPSNAKATDLPLVDASDKPLDQQQAEDSHNRDVPERTGNHIFSNGCAASDFSNTSPLAVNPNWIFSSGSGDKSGFDEEISHLQPYRQQFLQLQQEQRDHAQRKIQKSHHSSQASSLGRSSFKKTRGRPRLKRTTSENISSRHFETVPLKRFASMIDDLESHVWKNPVCSDVMSNDENTNPSPPCSANTLPGSNNSWTGRSRTSVSLAVSPGGRATAEAVLLEDSNSDSEVFDVDDVLEDYETDSSTDVDESVVHSFASITKSTSIGFSYSRNIRSLEGGPFRPKLSRFDTAPGRLDSSPNSENPKGSIYTKYKTKPQLTPRKSIAKSPTRDSIVPNALRSAPRSDTFSDVGVFSSPCKCPLTPSLRSVCEESDHSEAETVLDGGEPGYAGDAIQALRLVVARRKSSILGPISSPSLLNTPPSKRRKGSFRYETSELLHYNKNINSLSNNQEAAGIVTDICRSTPGINTSPMVSEVSNGTLVDDNEIRCGCGIKEDCGTLMVQCDACNKWLHMKCEGLRRKRSLPEVFICSFCNGSRSALKSRTRGAIHHEGHLDQASSPLSRKSGHHLKDFEAVI